MEEKVEVLKKLFLEKKYTELIFEIETNLEEKYKTTPILNLLGACILLRTRGKKSKEDLAWASSVFKQAHLKERQTNHGLLALVNFINISVDIKTFYEVEINLKEIFSYFDEAQEFPDHNEVLILAILRVYKYLNNLEKTLYYLKILVDKKNCKISTICSYIYYNCFKNAQPQEFFFEQAKLLNKRLPKYEEEKLTKINNNNNKKKISLAFLSSDIVGKHSITYFLKTILSKYDKNKYKIFLIFNNVEEDLTTNSFKELVDESFNIKGLDDIKAINLIRQQDIDIIIDIMGLTSDNRITILKNRLALIQISWLGYCNTTGLENMDYIISDQNLIYQNEEKLYTEKIIFLPKIWNCHSGFDFERKEHPLPFKKNKHITFGSFNNYNKINNDVVEAWSKILKQVSDSKLILKSSIKKDTDKLKELFKKHDVAESVTFHERSDSFEEHLNLYKEIDIALDTFPYNGVTTSFEAIWMSVPVLTMKGFNFNSRCGESINKNIDMNCLIAENKNDYIFKAVELSKNTKKLISIRKEIFENVASSALFDTTQFSLDFFKSLERVYNKL
tara:strand:- start:456 stop:2138 length:1683 start_codon:yes stop_codon:yes gene_type:complete